MRGLKNAVLALVSGALLAGCGAGSPLGGALTTVVGNDLDRTVALAQKYGKPEVAKCAMFLSEALHAEDGMLAKIEELRNEDTSGLLSAALKAALLAEMVRGLNDPAKKAEFEAKFRSACNAVAGDIMMDIARDAARIGKKRIGM